MTGDAIYVLVPGAELDSVEAPRVVSQVRAAIEMGARGVVFDMRHVTFMDSGGLRVVLETLQQVGEERVAVANVGDQVLRLLATTGVDERIQLFATVDAAVASVASAG